MFKSNSLTFVFLLFTVSTYSQLYNFKNFGIGDGLTESRINALCEDQRGNLWIGTSGAGLVRFDGYTFYYYFGEDGLSNNFVHAIYEDSSGKLWIGTEEGIFVYDGIQFIPFKPLGKQLVRSIVQDASHHFWFGTDNGLYKFDGKTLLPFRTTQKGIVDKTINFLHCDKDANLWIGTPTGLAQLNKQTFTFYSRAKGLPSNNITAIAEDRKGNIWLATANGVSKFDGHNFVNYSSHDGLRSNDVNVARVDNKGNLWFGTSAGVVKYDGKTFQAYEISVGQSDHLVTCIYNDSQGNLWFGSSEKGLSKLDSERFIHYPENDQMGKRVYSIIQSINGNIICGTSLGGTTVFDGKHYALLDKREGFTSSIVQSFYYGADSTLWVGTQDEGVYRFGRNTSTRYTVEDGLVSNNITGFLIDRTGNLWLATADSGISVMKVHGDSLRMIKNFSNKNGLASNKISAIVNNGAGSIWIGSEDKGINTIAISEDNLDGTIKQLSTNDGLISNTIHTIITDTLGNVYIGTSKGLNIFDGKQFIAVTKAQGLVSNNIYSLTWDRAKNLWAGTERGVEMIMFAKLFSNVAIRHFDAEEGFKGVEVYRNSSCTDRAGNLWFGTVNGLVKYNPREDVESKAAPRIHITGIKLFFDKIEETEYVDSVSAWYSTPSQLTLPYHQNNLTFSFVGIHHRNPQAVRYKWILEGFSKDWSPALAERQAVFSNLPPGKYTFKVMACNEYNIWNEKPATFMFSIEPPLWQRWWARVAGILIFLGIVALIFNARVQRIHAKNKIIQERLEMEKSILELEQEAARLQMNPHFIFNCLNSIQGFISTNDPFQAKKYLAKFAKLMRLILENAREEFIPLQNEIHILENYLELEKLATHQKFDFSITTDDAMDADKIQIPPMMIQPFVENAIIHGIKKKEGRGRITIHFKINGDVLTCVVHDDGIGRKGSGQINGQTRSNHKSTGISVTQKRLEQYGQHRKVKAGVEIVDLEENGNPIGTKVVISTPFEA